MSAVWKAPTPRKWTPETPHPVIDILPEQKTVTEKGGTMRLGAYPALLVPRDLLVQSLYDARRSLRTPSPPL